MNTRFRQRVKWAGVMNRRRDLQIMKRDNLTLEEYEARCEGYFIGYKQDLEYRV